MTLEWQPDAIQTSIDSAGRIVVPKVLRDRLGLAPGTTVDLSAYGAGIQILPLGRTAKIRRTGGETVAESDTEITDDDVFDLIDSIRR